MLRRQQDRKAAAQQGKKMGEILRSVQLLFEAAQCHASGTWGRPFLEWRQTGAGHAERQSPPRMIPRLAWLGFSAAETIEARYSLFV